MIISSFEPFASTYSSVSYGTSEQTAEADGGGGDTEQNPDGSSADASNDAAAEDKGSAEAKPDEDAVDAPDADSGESADTGSEDNVPKGEQAPEKSDKSDNEGDKLEYRELDVVVSEDTYTDVEKSGKYAGKELPTYAFSFMSRFWKALSGEAAELPTEDEIKARAKRNVPVKVSVKGLVPEKIHAEVKYIEFSNENEKEEETEKGLFGIEVTLVDKDGNIYVPAKGEPIEVTIKGGKLKSEIKKNDPVIIYAYAENEDRNEKYTKKYKSVLERNGEEEYYAADVLVYQSKGFDRARRLYSQYDKNKKYADGEDAVRFTEDKHGLGMKNDSVTFAYDFAVLAKAAGSKKAPDEESTLKFVVAAQQPLTEADEQVQEEEPEQQVQKKDTEGKEESKPADDEKETSQKTDNTKEQVLTAGNGKTYKVTAEISKGSGIPENAELQITQIRKNNAEYSSYVDKAAKTLMRKPNQLEFAYVFDISLVDPVTGEHYQPDETVSVRIDLLKEDIKAGDSINVVHFPDQSDDSTPLVSDPMGKLLGKSDAEIMKTSVTDGAVEFETDGFSIYVVTGSNGETVTPQCTYTFYVWNSDLNNYTEYQFKDDKGNSLTKQIVTSGDELVVPQMTSNDDKVFSGWYEGNPDGSGGVTLAEEPYDFDNITITEDSAVNLYAVYTSCAKVIFHDQYDTEAEKYPVAFTRSAELASTEAKVKISDLKLENIIFNNKEMGFLGWSYTEVETPGIYEDDEHNSYVITPDTDGCITVTGETHLYPVFKETHLLSFYAAKSGQGASYNGPKYLFEDEYLDKLPTTSMPGKDFDGWYTGTMGENNTVNYGKQISDAEGILKAGADDAGVYVSNGKLYLRASTTLYAKWENKTTAKYKILYWTQNGTGSDYIYKETKEGDDLTGNVGEMISVPDTYKADDRYTGYHLKEEPASAELKANGSTVLDVYYDHDSGYEPGSGTYTLTFMDSVPEDGKTSADLPQTSSVEKGASLAGYAIEDPKTGRTGYKFRKWFLDPCCEVEADLDSMTMPDQDLTLYAGWALEKYVVSIDPNYGELNPLVSGTPTGTGATYFTQTIESEPIAEYTYVKRNYVESSSGTYYYVHHAGDGKGGSVWPDRYTYYTTDPGKATEDTTFEYSPGTYTYAGWYEVNEDGTETPYTFGEKTDHNTNLKLHWKKSGMYYLAYDAGEGTLENGEKTELLPDSYSDNANITLTRTAAAPAGSTFVGWKLKDSESSMIYTPGQTFELHSDDAKRISGKDVVTLEAVYMKVGTASIVYDANGGTISDTVSYGQIPVTSGGETTWVDADGTVDTDKGTATVSGLANNTKIRLSTGSGFNAPSGTVFLGWSDKKVCDDSASFYDKDSTETFAVNAKEPKTLYAVWGSRVTYNLNSEDADWDDEWDPAVYTKDDDTNTYSQDIKVGNSVSEPAKIPVYTGSDGKVFSYWATRTGTGTDGDPYEYTEYDFSQPVTGALELYAFWSSLDAVKVHAVDSSDADLADKTDDDDWQVEDVTVTTEATELNANSNVTAPDGYEFAFAATAADMASVSQSKAVTAIKYEDKAVKVQYEGESAFRALGEGYELYFVYYQKKPLSIGYKSMKAGDLLNDVTATGAPDTTDALGIYSMAESITSPLSFVTGYTYYAFAVGSAGSGAQIKTSDLDVITNTADAEKQAPTLRVRNTWRGFQYTTETGDSANWTDCGFDPQLYVIYYSQQPTVVTFKEKTVGTSAVMDTEFTFDLLVTQTTETTTSVQTQVKNGSGEWEDSGDPKVTTTTGDPVTIYDSNADGNEPYKLKNGESESTTLFYSSSEQIDTQPGADEDTRTVTTTTVVTAQTAVITQAADDSFKTDIDGTAQTEEPYEYTVNADGSGETRKVTFTNTHKSLPVEIHVAMVEDNGADGIIQRDAQRAVEETSYKFNVALGESEELLTKLPADGLFAGDKDTYAFGTAAYGTGSEGSSVSAAGLDVASVAYVKTDDNVYELVLKDSDGKTIGELGSNNLYYIYYPMPEIRYVKEAEDGTLTDITGCLMNPQTGSIEASDAVTYSHEHLTINGKEVEQNQRFEIPLSGLTISQSGNNFRMPAVLDDGLSELYLSYAKLGAGNGDAAAVSDVDLSENLTMHIRTKDNTLQYSFDKETWKDLSISGKPTVYAIYTERGYDFLIRKTINMSESGENPIFSGASFPVTISSDAITKSSYAAEGAESDTVPATPAAGGEPGTITLTAVDGMSIRIKGLKRGDYTITESDNNNYTLTAVTGSIVGGSTTPMTVTDNTTVSLTLDSERKVELTNSPKAICRIDDNYFYTLRSMTEYVDENIANKTATAEMLTDYVMPAEDAAEIPDGCHITLTSADSIGHSAIITRTADLADVPMFTNNGTLTLTGIMLDGNSVDATAPVIQSAGDLTIGDGTTIQYALNGGAIKATKGDITVGGAIINCSAAKGGAINHSGNGTIKLEGTGTINNNTATAGDGGAIWLSGGTVRVSGTASISGNKAENGNGGAIHTNNAVIEIDQGGSITGNTAKAGGAIYAETGTITISQTEGVEVKPAVTGNTALDGNGGAIYVDKGSVTVSGGSVSNNGASNGNGGAIYTNAAPVTVSGSAEVKSNTASAGGAIYTASGAVTISGGSVSENTAASGNGGAVYAGTGAVTVSGGSVSHNTSTNGSGGAVYADKGNVILSGNDTTLTNNTAKTDGGAVYAGSGTVTVSLQEMSSNTATDGKGGSIYAESGAVSITNTTLTKNSAGTSGGAVYAGSGAISANNATFGTSTAGSGNTAGTSGGAIYAGSGNVTLSGGSMSKNTVDSGNGGALYAGSGNVSLSNGSMSENTAASGKGGAVYVDSGAATMTTETMNGNSAVNGAAVFVNTGRATLNAGSYTGNIASEGGAVGVGDTNARLYFTGNVKVMNNTLGTGSGAPKSNVYLDQDDDAVINIDSLGTGANIGIHVPDSVVNTRSVPGARFAVYTSDANVNKITNDRFPALTVQKDTAAKKLYWGNAIKVEVRYLGSFSGGFPPAVAGSSKYTNDSYYPDFNDGAISELATELFNKYNINIGSASAVYATAFQEGAASYSDYVTNLTWNTDESKWILTKRNGSTTDLNNKKIIIYYSEPAYIAIENNTDMPLDVSDFEVNNTSVINSATVAGYGMVFAKNGAIRSALLPVTADDLKLGAGTSINLLIPGGRNMGYTLDGQFTTSTEQTVRLRRTNEDEENLAVQSDGNFDQFAGTTLNTSGTYQIIFGDDKYICKVVDKEGVEHPYSKISDAISAIVNPPYELKEPKKATIEMLTDYLLPASDYVLIPRGYDITLTTASKTEGTYRYNGESDRAIISRDSENKESMIDAWNGSAGTDTVNSLDGTALRIKELILDGKSVRGDSDGGAIKSKYVNVYIDHVDFKNVYAKNGGAMLIMFSAKDKTNKPTVKNTILEVRNSHFTGCTSWTTETSNRLGGGAIVTNAETMTLDNCHFDTCTAVDQAGAVFHRVDGNYNSWTNVSNCSFTNCSANAAGGLELDSKTITVTNTEFNHCVASQRNGGGFNVYALNAGTPTADCWVTVSGCTFNDCQLTTTNTNNGNGGGFRCNAVYTKVENSTFTNNQALYGGGFCISNGNAKKGEVYGCTFERNTANQGGGIYGKPYELIIGDYTYTDDNGVEQTRHTEIKNCTSKNEGGGIYHDKNADGTSLKITNATISGNRTTNGSKNGGGIFTNCRAVTINGSTITDNSCTNLGGGVYAKSYTSLSINDSDISRNIASSNGGGVWFDADNDTNRAKQVLTIKGSTINGNTSNGIGGGIYTLAKTVTIGASDTRTDSDGEAIRSSVSNNTAKTNGGGIYQSRNVEGSKLEISDTEINGNTANNTNTGTGQGGGGIYAGVRTLTVSDSTISNNNAKSHGGGILFEIDDDGARNNMSLTINGSTLDSNTSDGNGGGVYTKAKTVTIQGNSTISNCTAKLSGGGLYQSRDAAGSSLTVTGSKISGCVSNDTNTAWDRGGGGILGLVQSMTVTGSEISGNSAKGKGGGINMGFDSSDYMLIVDSSTLTGNTSSNQGGGIWTRSQLTLRKNTEITGNRLTTNTTADCAGVYLNNNRTLFVGVEGETDDYKDTVIVRGNTTANGSASNLRLWETNSENNKESVFVYCSLSKESEIRVVNANKVGTWFGSTREAGFNGFADGDPVFRADASTLYGIIDRTDPEGKKIIWAGPPIAKITDGEGHLLYLSKNASDPAIFDLLGTGDDSYSTAAAFNMLCSETPELYRANGDLYDGSDYCIKMLDSYVTMAIMNVIYVEGRTITFTTAGKNEEKEDGYPYIGSGTRATVTRGTGIANDKSTLITNGRLVMENIVLDGGSESEITPAKSTRCLWVNSNTETVTLGENALLQNGVVSADSKGGGGVYIQSGTLSIEGGVIRNCTANKGGGVYEEGGNLNITSGGIYQCSATGNGGGVYQFSGGFTMEGGSITYGSADMGGGIFVANNKSFNMTGGSITNNHANTAGGGIAIGGNGTRLYFYGKVNISGNTSDASVASNKICNVELNQDSNDVINTYNGGLLPGAYIGVYVDGDEGTNSNYDKHGVERKPFGTFTTGDTTTTFYSFVNDRNGLKGGLIEEGDSNYVHNKNCIYWIQIFSLNVGKKVEHGASTSAEADEEFLFKVNIRGKATVAGQLDAKDIDSSTGDYGEMTFNSNNNDTTTAVFALKDGEDITGFNLSEGLSYEVIEYLIVSGGSYPNQHKRYAAMPMNNYDSATETLTVDGTTYTVVKANTYGSTIGENKSRTDVDPYTSKIEFTNLIPVCKITDKDGNLLYRKYYWNKITNNKDEMHKGAGGSYTDGPNIDVAKRPFYYAPAVYTELTGDQGAYKALEGELFTSNSQYPPSYTVSNGVKIQMLVADYNLNGCVVDRESNIVTLTTASASDALFPKQDPGTTSTIHRSFDEDSMFKVSGDLTLKNIIIDGAKENYTVDVNGGIANVVNGGKLTVADKATLQNSKTAEGRNGGAIYVHHGGTVDVTGGTINKNTSKGNGAGIYLSEGSKLYLSGDPSFGGAGVGASGILTTNGNFKDGELIAQKNGGKNYTQARQDIFIAGYNGSDGDTNAVSLIVKNDITAEAGSIWVWAQETPHYKTLEQFAKIEHSVKIKEKTCNVFRNAQPDSKTDNDTGDYLFGTLEGDKEGFVYWSGISGKRKVILRKVDSSYDPQGGRKFTIYKGTNTTAYKPKDEPELANLSSGSESGSGCIWIGELPYGWYIVEETDPHRYFYIVITKSGTYGTIGENGKDIAGGYSNLSDAQSNAQKLYNSKK